MKKTPSFEELMVKLSPTLLRLEEKRKELKRKVTKRILLWSGGILITMLATAFCFPVEFVVIVGLMLLLTAMLIIILPIARPLQQLYKEQVITEIVECLVENGKYSPERGISESEFNKSNLFIHPDRYSTEDLISGFIDRTSFCFAEIHAEEKRTSSNGKTTKTTWVTIFKGFMFIADFHKDFSGQTVVCRNSFLRLRRGRVKLEDTEFERRFDVFSSDQVEARYLLSPSMMERIIALDKRFGNGIVLSFSDSNVMIAISNSTNHFECGLWKKIDNMETLRREYNLIVSMIGIVEELNLNTRIWSKE